MSGELAERREDRALAAEVRELARAPVWEAWAPVLARQVIALDAAFGRAMAEATGAPVLRQSWANLAVRLAEATRKHLQVMAWLQAQEERHGAPQAE